MRMEETQPKEISPCWLPFSCGAFIRRSARASKSEAASHPPEARKWWTQHTDGISSKEGTLRDSNAGTTANLTTALGPASAVGGVDRHLLYMARENILPTLRAEDRLRCAMVGNDPKAVFDAVAEAGLLGVNDKLLSKACKRGAALDLHWLPLRTVTAEILNGVRATSEPTRGSLPLGRRQCAICKLNYKIGDSQALLPCYHQFHESCITASLAECHVCPICKEPCVETHYNYGVPAFQTRTEEKVDTDQGQPPNVLFVENLSHEVNQQYLALLFGRYPGFREARLIKGSDAAYIEYRDELQAEAAKRSMQGYLVTPEVSLRISRISSDVQ